MDSFFLSLNFHHSSFIIHHLKYYICLAPSLISHHSIFFTLFVGPIPVTRYNFFFFSIPKFTEPSEKKKKNPKQTEPVKERRRKIIIIIIIITEQPTRRIKEKKKKSQKWSKVAAGYYLWVPYVCLITILSLSYELWKLKTTKICFQFP